MRAAEFLRSLADVIEKLDGPSSNEREHDAEDKEANPLFIPPLQQDIELKKADQGKDSPVIQKLTQPNNEHDSIKRTV